MMRTCTTHLDKVIPQLRISSGAIVEETEVDWIKYGLHKKATWK